MEQLTEEQAIKFGESGAWEGLSLQQRAEMQILQEKLCMPFGVFHEALEHSLGRPVFTHELALNYEGIKKELFEEGPSPSLADIIEMIPEEKRMVVWVEDEKV